MSSSKRNDGDWIGWAILIAVAIVAYIIWQFSVFFGLDMSTGWTVFVNLAAWGLLVGALVMFGEEYFFPIRFGNIWPVLLALLWMCWWPALDHWASKQAPSFMSIESAAIWWRTWYTKGGVLVAIIGVGYAIKHFFGDD